MAFCGVSFWDFRVGVRSRWRGCVRRGGEVVCGYTIDGLRRGSEISTLRPADALRSGSWCKLICGASLEDLPFVTMVSEVYTLAGVDCIDCAADPAVVSAVLNGIDRANEHLKRAKLPHRRPYVMVSINDDEDPHFRKAFFDPSSCPSDCPRPCERVCPTTAISSAGVMSKLCYGCGRCVPVCPKGLILTTSYVRSPEAVVTLLQDYPIDAVEIHTTSSHGHQFGSLWNSIESWVTQRLKLVAVSFPDGDELAENLQRMHTTLLQAELSGLDLIWQTDGRPMSGDIGRGTTHPSIQLASKVLRILDDLNLSGYVQLAGGTNNTTIEVMGKKPGFHHGASGIAFGGYARKIVQAAETPSERLESAIGLLYPIKTRLRTNPRKVTSLHEGQAH